MFDLKGRIKGLCFAASAPLSRALFTIQSQLSICQSQRSPKYSRISMAPTPLEL